MTEETKINSILGNLFYGQINEEDVFPFPNFTEEQKEMAKEMVNAVNKFAEGTINSAKMDEDGVMPDEVVQGLAELGLCGLAVPEEMGGLGLDYTLYARVFQEVASNDGATATMVGAHQSIGYRALLNEGTDEQKQKWLPLLASGEKIAAFCLTEPGSGSDAYSIKTKAVDNGDGTFTINGQKLWITNAGRAEFYSVFCKEDVEVDGEKKEKISCFIVEKDFEGVSFGEKEEKMGIRASETRAVYFDNVKVPAANRIGEPGKGFKIAMNVLNSGRLSLGSGCVGGMKYALSLATNHTKNRKQFDKYIHEFEMIQGKLAEMASLIYATESMIYLTTGKMVQGMDDYSLESACCKVFGSENLWKTVDMAMQIAAGNGYMKEYPYERMMRDSRINMIFEGTNEILRCFIALMGVKGPADDLKELGKVADISSALNSPIKSLGLLTGFATRRLGNIIGTKALTKCHPDLSEESEKFSSMMGGFAIQVENALIKYGPKIFEFELAQDRIANMAINLYATLAVLSRTTAILENENVSKENKDYTLKLAKHACKTTRRRFVGNLKGMQKNYDRLIREISDQVVEHDGYALDVVDY